MDAKRILIADDDVTFLMLMRSKLEEAGYEVDQATGGSLASQKIQNEPFDLVLMDYDMPDLRGHAVCEELRAKDKTKKLPIIITTAYTTKGEDYFKDLGATDVCYKPIDFDALLQKIEQLCQ